MTRLNYDFVKEGIAARGYKLLSTEYINNNTPLSIQCDKGHTYEAPWRRFSSGHGCPICSGRVVTIAKIKKYIEDRGESLVTTKYKNNLQKLEVKCAKGHLYKSPWISLQRGHGCPYCAGNKVDKSSVFKAIEEEKYKVLEEEYSSNRAKIKVECDKGHIYLATWSNFKNGKRCPSCFCKSSKAEKDVFNFVKGDLKLTSAKNNIVNIIPYKELDIYIPEHNLAIEYCGLYWHNDDHLFKSYHRVKLDSCIRRDIRLITIFEDEWINQKEIVISKIKQALNLTENRIYARKTELKEITAKEANLFYEETHLQGKTRGELHTGLFFNNELVACMTLGKPTRAHTAKNTLEIKRYATKLDTSVVGGFSKLLKYAINYTIENNYKKIRSHNDLRWGRYTDNVYEKTGFEKVGETKYTPHYTKNGKRYRNFSLRKTPEERLTGKTEVQLRKEQGYNRIFDCGHQTWDLEVNNDK